MCVHFSLLNRLSLECLSKLSQDVGGRRMLSGRLLWYQPQHTSAKWKRDLVSWAFLSGDTRGPGQ